MQEYNFFEIFEATLLCLLAGALPPYIALYYWNKKSSFKFEGLMASIGFLLFLGIFSSVSFWAFFQGPLFGVNVVRSIQGLSLILAIRLYYLKIYKTKLKFRDVIQQNFEFAYPFILHILLTLFFAVLFFSKQNAHGLTMGYLHNRPMQLPIDAVIPYMASDLLFAGLGLRGFLPGWHSSDRPHLMTGFILLFSRTQRDLSINKSIVYEICGIFLQLLVIHPFWSILRSLKFKLRDCAFITLMTVFSGFFYTNSVFVWPKLIAAAFVLAAIYVSFDECDLDKRVKMVLAGLFSSLAMFSHGGSFFTIAAVCLWQLYKYRMTFIKYFPAAFLVSYFPWIWYQKIYDPPGTGLLNMHLAAASPDDPTPLLKLIYDCYASKTWSELLDAKWLGIRQFVGQIDSWTIALTKLDITAIPKYAFFSTPLALQFAAPGLLLFFLPKVRALPSFKTLKNLYYIAWGSIFFWFVLMIHGQVVHQGSYSQVMLLLLVGTIPFSVYLSDLWKYIFLILQLIYLFLGWIYTSFGDFSACRILIITLATLLMGGITWWYQKSLNENF